MAADQAREFSSLLTTSMGKLAEAHDCTADSGALVDAAGLFIAWMQLRQQDETGGVLTLGSEVVGVAKSRLYRVRTWAL